jgi:predicted adenylyl cyclase CyaB
MAQNLELKIETDSNDKLKSKLYKLKIKLTEILRQKDIYYVWKKGLLKLRCVNGSYQLIKYIRDESGSDRWSDYEILQLEGKDVERYLAEVLSVEAVVEKVRELYIYKNTRIHLDAVKKLGEFLELETVVNGKQSEAQAEFNEVVEMLKLNLFEPIRCSYRDLILNKK